MSDTAESDRAGRSRRGANPDRLPIWWTGLTGVVGMLCCVGPTVLALLGVVSAATAFVWATDLYDDYAWWFRIGGLGVLALYPHLVERHEVSQPHVTTGLRHQRERRFLLQGRCGVLHAARCSTSRSREWPHTGRDPGRPVSEDRGPEHLARVRRQTPIHPYTPLVRGLRKMNRHGFRAVFN